MWFRALTLYPLTAPLPFTLDELEAGLGHHPFRPCGALELASQGFEPPLGPRTQAFVYPAEEVWSIRWVSEEKRLPTGFVREQLAEKVLEYEAQEGHAPSAQVKKEMREAIEHALLPRLIPRRRRLLAGIDAKRGWVMVDSATARQAEALLDALRQATGTLPVRPWRTQDDWSAAMTRWLDTRELPEGFAFDQTCVLTAEDEEGGSATLRKHDLTAEEVQAHLASGKKVTRLGLVWRERMRLVLDAQGGLRGLKPTDVLLEPLKQAEDDDAIACMEQTLILQNLTLRALLDDLNVALGGLDEPRT